MLKQITTYVANNTSYVIGTDLFAGTRPDTAPDKCVTILETGGGAPVFDLPDYLDKMVQVLTRGKSYFEGQELAQEIYDLLHGKAGITTPTVDEETYYINAIEALMSPQSIGQDEKGRFEFSTNFVFRIQDQQ